MHSTPTHEILGINDELLEFVTDVKYSEVVGFHGENLERHFDGTIGDAALILLLENRRSYLTNA